MAHLSYDQIKTVERMLNRRDTGDIGIANFILPRGLQHRQYVGIAMMVEAMKMHELVLADPPHMKVTADLVADMVDTANELMNSKRTA